MTAPEEQPDALEELIAEAEQIAALVPTSDAGVAFTGLVAAIRELQGENFDLDSIARVNAMNFADYQAMSGERRILAAENDRLMNENRLLREAHAKEES